MKEKIRRVDDRDIINELAVRHDDSGWNTTKYWKKEINCMVNINNGNTMLLSKFSRRLACRDRDMSSLKTKFERNY